MFKREYPLDAMVSGHTSIPPPPPPTTAFNLQYNNPHQPGFSAFTPEYQQFPYTFSSASPPTYSWANTNSTDIMKFTGSNNPLPLDTSTYHSNNFGSVPKRKIDLDADLPQPPKMRITEEKVSASLRDMHISSEFKAQNYWINSNPSVIDNLDNHHLANIGNITETSKADSQTLVMCEELRKLNKIDSIIPQPLLNIKRSNNAVVVWKPTPVMDLVRSFSNYDESKSTVVIREITDEEENELNKQDEMIIEDDNCVAFEDDEMEL